MQKLLYTEEGLQIMRRSSDAGKTGSSEQKQPSAKPDSLRISKLSRQCNRVRVSTLKNTFTVSSPENLLHLLPFSRIKNQINHIPKVLSADNFNMKDNNNDILAMASSKVHAPPQTTKDGISRHHKQSLRLRTGDWFQWKNLDMSPQVVQDFQKRLKLHQLSEEEIRMREEKKQTQYTFELIRMEQINRKTAENLKEKLEQQNSNHNLELDEFWQQMKQNTKYFSSHDQDMAKQREGQLQRLQKCKSKFAVKKCYIPSYQKVQVQQPQYYDI